MPENTLKSLLASLLIPLFLASCSRSSPTTAPPVTAAITITTPSPFFFPTPTRSATPTPANTATPTHTPLPTLTPTPAQPTISEENAKDIAQLLRIGNGDYLGIAWWPDVLSLAVTSRAGIFLFDPTTLEQIRYIPPPDESIAYEIALSPDGRTVASIEQNDARIRIWDAETGQTIHILDEHKGNVHALAFSPDGRYFASGGRDEPLILLWNMSAWEVIAKLEGKTEELVFSPDGSLLVSAGADFPGNDVGRVWDVEKRRLVGTFPDSWNFFHPILVTSDNKMVINDWKRGLEVRDAKSAKLLVPSKPEREIHILAVLGPDGRSLYQGSDVWDIETGEYRDSIEPLCCPLIFTPDGSRFINSMGMWELKSERKVASWLFFSEIGGITSAIFSPDGKYLATDRGAYEVKTGQYNLLDMRPPQAFSSDGRRFASLCNQEGEDRICMYDFPSGDNMKVLEGEIPWLQSPPIFSPDGTLLAMACGEDWQGKWEARVWDTGTGRLRFTLPGRNLRSVAFSPDGSLLLAGGSRTIKFISTESGEILKEDFQPSEINVVAFSPDGKILASGGESEVILWDSVSYQKLARLDGKAQFIDFSPDGTLIAAAGSVTTPPSMDILNVWQVGSGELVYSIRKPTNQPNSLRGIEFGPRGTLLLMAGLYENTLQLLDSVTGELLWSYNLKPSPILRDIINFSSDGKYISYIGNDGTVRLLGIPP